MSLHRITAGSGYDYLTRQVAAMDSTERGHTGLASYYTEKGEIPGRWVGSGLAGIDGLSAGDVVTAEQMLALFGSGHHPLAAQRAAALADDPDATERDVMDAIRLGQPFAVHTNDISPFRIEVARRLNAINTATGRLRGAAVDIEERARIRTEVGLEWFRRDFGRAPLNQRELAGHIARLSRQKTTAVAGFDLTFSPVKSVSALWALAEPQLATTIERAHQQAVADALRFIETHALFTRTGAHGVRQVDVQGLIGAAFTHRDSRAGDPDLHTHVAVANKVQTLDGKWLSIDSRVLHKAITAASETYNTALEAHLTRTLGLRFAPRAGDDAHKRPVREIVGVEPKLLERWSARRHRIVARQAELATAFQRDHGRPPTPVEAIALAQQATLETREAKHEPRSLAEQRTTWRAQAREVLCGDDAITVMIHRALHPAPAEQATLNPAWFDQACARILSRVEQDRSAWQSWHVRAEALRYVRAENVPADHTEEIVDWLTNNILDRYSIPLSPASDGVDEPEPLRRLDGASVYTVAGNRLYTSTRNLEAEQRILTNAGRHDGRTVPDTAVDLALLETTANGVQLNAGQVALVQAMASSAARVQLAIAPAGAGKTTAMQALARAWTNSDGTVIGLAPSAVAAAGLGEQIGAHSDTIAKLAWHLANGNPPAWMNQIGPDTLVIIDEAGMADTLSLDAVINHVIEAGGSVRLIGDDQQLAAIGAGGVLRDIQATHGALHLNELVRFTDPAEGSASLALREGRTEALGFYLDRDRIHVGTPDTMLDQLFSSWAADRAAGLDSVMLAPTRDLVSQLNQRARTHRLNDATPDAEVELADGNQASPGDVIITRRNDRRLRLNATDWVKNGDRWAITAITGQGVRVRHTQTGRHISLPHDYVAEWAELGYATTTHTAQGVTADTCHGLLTGDETRQQAYTMLTRGRRANTCYLTITGDGDPHTFIRPEVVHPATAVDQLERILACDESPLSATTILRHAGDPRLLLGEATARYADAIVFAADHTTSPADRHTIEVAAARLLPGITTAEAWPALLAQLLSINADNRDPIDALTRAAAEPIVAGRDPAAILAYRLDDTNRLPGPLPWLNPIAASLTRHPVWGDYLAARADLVRGLADQLRTQVEQRTTTPTWAADGPRPPTELVADTEIWRASNQVPDSDRRPTGEPQHGARARRCQERLDQRLGRLTNPALDEWGEFLRSFDPLLRRDPYLPTLAIRIGQAASVGVDVHQLLRQAADEGPLPEEHTGAALWWRISGRLSPAVAKELGPDRHMVATWLPRLQTALGKVAADELQQSTWWPALVTTFEHALQKGWTLDALTSQAPTELPSLVDTCQAWVWRLSIATQPIPEEDYCDPPDEPPQDLTEGWAPADHLSDMVEHDPRTIEYIKYIEAEPVSYQPEFEDPDAEAERILAIEALIRNTMRPPGPSAAEIRRQQDRADAWRECPYTPERLAHINELATQYYESRLPGSWAQPYLTERLRQDITGHAGIRPGYAPAGWTHLVQHLRSLGVTDDQLITAGVASRTASGRLIDRFRDRLVFPITHGGQILGFVARRNPASGDEDSRGPKYLNSPETPLFHKGDQLYIPTRATGGIPIPVLVEGPMDAIAVGIASNGQYVGVAPLGTSLTEPQATQLVSISGEPVIATDADAPGRTAAQRDYWILASLTATPRSAHLPEASDPAALLSNGTSELLLKAVASANPMWLEMLDQRLSGHPEDLAGALTVVASAPSADWPAAIASVARRLDVPDALIRASLPPLVQAWNADPHGAMRPLATERMPLEMSSREGAASKPRGWERSRQARQGRPTRRSHPDR